MVGLFTWAVSLARGRKIPVNAKRRGIRAGKHCALPESAGRNPRSQSRCGIHGRLNVDNGRHHSRPLIQTGWCGRRDQKRFTICFVSINFNERHTVARSQEACRNSCNSRALNGCRFLPKCIQNQLARDAPRSVSVDWEENSQDSQDYAQENGDGFSAIVLMVFTAFKKDGGRHNGARFRRLPG